MRVRLVVDLDRQEHSVGRVDPDALKVALADTVTELLVAVDGVVYQARVIRVE